MKKKTNSGLFNLIAPVYGLFYRKQKHRYNIIIEGVKKELDIISFNNVIDVGCGTGA